MSHIRNDFDDDLNNNKYSEKKLEPKGILKSKYFNANNYANKLISSKMNNFKYINDSERTKQSSAATSSSGKKVRFYNQNRSINLGNSSNLLDQFNNTTHKNDLQSTKQTSHSNYYKPISKLNHNSSFDNLKSIINSLQTPRNKYEDEFIVENIRMKLMSDNAKSVNSSVKEKLVDYDKYESNCNKYIESFIELRKEDSQTLYNSNKKSDQDISSHKKLNIYEAYKNKNINTLSKNNIIKKEIIYSNNKSEYSDRRNYSNNSINYYIHNPDFSNNNKKQINSNERFIISENSLFEDEIVLSNNKSRDNTNYNHSNDRNINSSINNSKDINMKKRSNNPTNNYKFDKLLFSPDNEDIIKSSEDIELSKVIKTENDFKLFETKENYDGSYNRFNSEYFPKQIEKDIEYFPKQVLKENSPQKLKIISKEYIKINDSNNNSIDRLTNKEYLSIDRFSNINKLNESYNASYSKQKSNNKPLIINDQYKDLNHRFESINDKYRKYKIPKNESFKNIKNSNKVLYKDNLISNFDLKDQKVFDSKYQHYTKEFESKCTKIMNKYSSEKKINVNDNYSTAKKVESKSEFNKSIAVEVRDKIKRNIEDQFNSSFNFHYRNYNQKYGNDQCNFKSHNGLTYKY